MTLTKDKKKEILASIQDVLKSAQSVVFFNFKGLKVNDTVQVRRTLKGAGVGYLVAKKSLTKKALETHSVTGTQPTMDGEIGIAYSKDLIAPAREIHSFAKKFKDTLKIVGGIFEGKYMNKEEMMTIALIPSRETLYAQVVQIINSPVSGFVRALDAIAKAKTQ
ncbi:MAG: 50S ribosomal protein L10 [Candidatus Paceibacterota bacterium]|jgi:large subunit ribosomal protein L10